MRSILRHVLEGKVNEPLSISYNKKLDSVRLAMSGLENSLPCRDDVMERCEASVRHLYKLPMCMFMF